MAVLVIMMQDVSPYERGDIIETRTEEQSVGQAVYNNSLFRVCNIPDMTIEEADVLKAPEMDLLKDIVVNERKYKVNINTLEPNPRTQVNSNNRAKGQEAVFLKNQLMAAIETKPVPDVTQEGPIEV